MPAPGKAELKRYIRTHPGDGRAWLLLAQELAKQEPDEEFEQALNRALQLLPDNYQAWMLAVNSVRNARGFEAARAWIQAAMAGPDQPRAPQLALGSLLLESAPSAGIEYFEQMVAADPAGRRARVLLAAAYSKSERLPDAVGCMQELVQQHPGSAEHWGMLAEYQLRNREFDAALESAEQSLQLDPDLAVSWEIKAEASNMLGQPEAALAAYKSLEKIVRMPAEQLIRTGNLHVRLEQFDAGEQYYRRALEQCPDSTTARLNLGLLSAARGNIQDSVRILEALLGEPGFAPQQRREAEASLCVLREHLRLRPLISHAVKTAAIGDLAAALRRRDHRLQTVDRMVAENLEHLAAQCRIFDFATQLPPSLAESRHLSFIDAWSQCKLPWQVGRMAAACNALMRGRAVDSTATTKRNLRAVYEANLDRGRLHADAPAAGDWQAWLRYWHARLMGDHPEKSPGQFKPISNTIGQKGFLRTVGVEHVEGTFQFLYEQLRPTVPEGPGRGVLMMIGVLLIHGFTDGNGRLARFILGWECEQAGHFGVMIPTPRLEQHLESMARVDTAGSCSLVLQLPADCLREVARILPEFEAELARLQAAGPAGSGY